MSWSQKAVRILRRNFRDNNFYNFEFIERFRGVKKSVILYVIYLKYYLDKKCRGKKNEIFYRYCQY